MIRFDDCEFSDNDTEYNELQSIYLNVPSSGPEVFNVGVAIIVELLLLSALSALSDLSLLSLLSPFSPFSLCPFFGPLFFGGGAFDMQP